MEGPQVGKPASQLLSLPVQKYKILTPEELRCMEGRQVSVFVLLYSVTCFASTKVQKY
jgi:hypothetical protein